MTNFTFLFIHITDVFRLGIWNKFSNINRDLLPLKKKLPEVIMSSKADSTKKKYSSGFKKWCCWANNLGSVNPVPADSFYISLYVVSLLQSANGISVIDDAIYSIAWGHSLAGFDNPCDSPFVKSVVQGARRILGKSVKKKEPITPNILSELVKRFAGDNENLYNLRIVTMCLIGYAGFFRFSELVNIKRSDILFESNFIVINIPKSKTDQNKLGSDIFISSTPHDTCPVKMLRRYIIEANIEDNSSEFIFRQLSFCKTLNKYKLRKSGPLSYTRAREILLEKMEMLGLNKKDFGLHSLRSGGATSAAGSGVIDRLFKKHGRWKSESAKDGYVKENLEEKLSVTKQLGKRHCLARSLFVDSTCVECWHLYRVFVNYMIIVLFSFEWYELENNENYHSIT